MNRESKRHAAIVFTVAGLVITALLVLFLAGAI